MDCNVRCREVIAMNYRITRLIDTAGLVVLRLSGRIQGEGLDTLRGLLDQEKTGVAIDLEEVSLVDREVVVFFASNKTRGIEIRNCPPYIQEWIDQERRLGENRRRKA
jgi:hypothetical protein